MKTVYMRKLIVTLPFLYSLIGNIQYFARHICRAKPFPPNVQWRRWLRHIALDKIVEKAKVIFKDLCLELKTRCRIVLAGMVGLTDWLAAWLIVHCNLCSAGGDSVPHKTIPCQNKTSAYMKLTVSPVSLIFEKGDFHYLLRNWDGMGCRLQCIGGG